MLDLNALQKLCDEATPEPWLQGDGSEKDLYQGDSVVLCFYTLGQERVLFSANAHFPYKTDVAFASTARTAMPQLINEVRRLRARVVELEENAKFADRALRMYEQLREARG